MTLPSVASLALPRPKLPKAVPGLAASPPRRHPKGGLVLYPPPLRWEPVYTRVCMRVTLHPRHAPPGARQGPRRLGCASSPPLELGPEARRERAGSRPAPSACGAARSRPCQLGNNKKKPIGQSATPEPALASACGPRRDRTG